jgi:putative PIN family toxin of toxin-antitoxin system
VSGLINPYGAPARVIQAVADRRVTAVVSEHLLDELAAVLVRPKFRRWVSVEDALAFVEALRNHGNVHDPPNPSPEFVRDPEDAYLVALAEGADAVIVTGDDDLLAADLTRPAITPRALAERLERS